MRIYVGNLSYETTEGSLAAAFQAHGTVESAAIVTDRESGQSRGFGFVEMRDQTQAEAAIRALNEAELDGRSLSVSAAREHNTRPSQRLSGGSRRRF